LSFSLATPVTFGAPAFKRYKADLKNQAQVGIWLENSTRRRTVEVQVYPKEIRIFEAVQRIACHPVLQGKHQSRLEPSHRQTPPRQQATLIDPGPDRGVSKRPLAFYDAVAQRLAAEAVR
jgi:hypothetical protein